MKRILTIPQAALLCVSFAFMGAAFAELNRPHEVYYTPAQSNAMTKAVERYYAPEPSNNDLVREAALNLPALPIKKLRRTK